MKHQLSVTWQHIRRSPYQAMAAIMIMSLTMFMGLSFLFLSVGSNQLLSYLEKRPRVIAFFNDTVTSESDVAKTVQKLKKTGKTASIKFVSKEEAIKIYRERNKDDPLLLEFVSANTLPTSLEVSAKNISDIPAIFKILESAPNLEEAVYQKEIVKTLISVLDKIRIFGIVLISFLLVTSLFVILTIIGMKISLRKDQIEIERLVGASKWYIRAPFLFEGIFYGVIGGVVSWGVIYLIILAATPYLTPLLSGLSLLPVSVIFMAEILGGVIGVGAVVGIFGSFLAVWRYLKN